MANPVNDLSILNYRLGKIEYFFEKEESKKIHQFLGGFFDIPKLLSLILYRKLNYVPFVKLRSTLRMAMHGMN